MSYSLQVQSRGKYSQTICKVMNNRIFEPGSESWGSSSEDALVRCAYAVPPLYLVEVGQGRHVLCVVLLPPEGAVDERHVVAVQVQVAPQRLLAAEFPPAARGAAPRCRLPPARIQVRLHSRHRARVPASCSNLSADWQCFL